MEPVHCPFCGCEHDPEITDMAAHLAPYIEGLIPDEWSAKNLNPESVQRGLRALRNKTGDDRYSITLKALRAGWTGD